MSQRKFSFHWLSNSHWVWIFVLRSKHTHTATVDVTVPCHAVPNTSDNMVVGTLNMVAHIYDCTKWNIHIFAHIVVRRHDRRACQWRTKLKAFLPLNNDELRTVFSTTDSSAKKKYIFALSVIKNISTREMKRIWVFICGMCVHRICT